MNSKIIIVVGLTFILSYTQFVSAKEQSRDDFIASMKTDLLMPCSDKNFMKCIGSNESECTTKVNQLIRDCKNSLPAVLTDTNSDSIADNFSVCFSSGIITAFSVSEKKYNTCSAQEPR